MKMPIRTYFYLSILVIAAPFVYSAKCSDYVSEDKCKAGDTQDCICPDDGRAGAGGKGAQICKNNGSGWEDCHCVWHGFDID
ncbi:MAG: hypothetical protein QNJ97_26825 [Myxococcota bacterium]|nr:hypothetical protein [Myxococcota bacterium]